MDSWCGQLEQQEEDEEGDEEVVVELEPPEPPVEVSEPPQSDARGCHRRRVPSASNLESWYAAVHAYSGAAASGGYGSLSSTSCTTLCMMKATLWR